LLRRSQRLFEERKSVNKYTSPAYLFGGALVFVVVYMVCGEGFMHLVHWLRHW
jgi:hypothetical protein